MARRPTQSFANYYGTYGAILREYRPWHEYVTMLDKNGNVVIDPATGEEKKVKGEQLGMSVTTVSPLLGFAHITVKVAGDTGTLDHPDIDDSFDTQNFIYVAFDNFVGSQYSMNNVTHYTGTASRVYLVDDPTGKQKK